MLETLELCDSSTPTASVIWLHGLGADGYDFAPVVQAMQPLPHIRFILPHAPSQPVTINGGYHMPAWYDIYGRDLTEQEDAAGIQASRTAIEALIAQEKERGIPASRIALTGFSQGGVIALHTGLRHPESLAGIIALSTYLALPHRLEEEGAPANRNIPVFLAHGRFDDIIPLATGLDARRILSQRGYSVEWHEYAMPHSVTEEEISDIRKFMLRILPGS